MTNPEIESLASDAPAHRYRILIAGDFGFGNVGDEATLTSIVDGLRGLSVAVEITVISGDPKRSACVHGVYALSWRDPVAIADVVQGVDLTILAGQFHDYDGFDPDLLLTPQQSGLSYFAAIAALSAFYLRPLMLYAVGVGPLLSEHGRLFTKAICDAAACITVRDCGSREQLIGLGILESRVSVTADPVFAFANGVLSARTYLAGAALRSWSFGVDQGFWERQVAAALDLLLDGEEGRAVFVPVQSDSTGGVDDAAVMRRVIAQMRHRGRADLRGEPQSIAELVSALGECRVVLNMERHSLASSALAGVPPVVLECDPQVSSLALELGVREFSMPLGGIDAVRLANLLRRALAEGDKISEQLQVAVAGMRARASDGVRLAAALLETKTHAFEPTPELMQVLAKALYAQMRFVAALVSERDTLEAQEAVEEGAEWKALRAREEALRQRSVRDSERIAYGELRVRRLCRELDQAKEELRTASRPAGALAGKGEYTQLEARLAALETKSLGAVCKRGLQVLLDLAQILTPELLRRLFRRYYLEYFYFRIYPERRPKATAAQNGAIRAPDGVNYSGYAPFIAFKDSLSRNLPMDFAVSSQGREGLVSIVLPVYNGARYIQESLDSVLAQSYRDWELIVVDDGSTDETLQILEHYAADSRVCIIRQEHQRLPAALSRGFAAAHGEFYTWTSDDNRMEPDQLAELVAFLRERQDVEMVYADEYIIDEDGRPAVNSEFCPGYQVPPGSAVMSRPQDPGELNFVSNNYIGGCFLYRAWAGRIVGEYDPGCFGFEDYDYWMRMNALFRVSHLGVRKPLYHYRLHPSSLTARDKQLRITERMREFVAVEESRRRFFAGSFDITFVGRHPWFPELSKFYKEYGNNVFSMEGLTETARYHYEVTRAFEKSVIVFSSAISAKELEGLLEWAKGERGAVLVLLTDVGGLQEMPDSILDAVHWIVAAGEAVGQQVGAKHDRKKLVAGSVAGVAYPLLAAVNTHCYGER
ncbi:MAG TPA: glycosyltransferase [Bryobacteraceae bacterium]|nr:glycosyltransferase [Bryobacteraceae bacterium]